MIPERTARAAPYDNNGSLIMETRTGAGAVANAPIRVDVTKAPGQFGLRSQQIDELIDAIIPGSGKIESP